MRQFLIGICAGGFYPIAPAPIEVSEEQWAKDNGERNAHIIRIENVEGKILWSRVQ